MLKPRPPSATDIDKNRGTQVNSPHQAKSAAAFMVAEMSTLRPSAPRNSRPIGVRAVRCAVQVSGYVSPSQFVHEGKLELLNTSGTVISMELREIKGVYFVREFGDSEALTRKTFTSRPRSEGLWVRLRFKDSEILEGLMPADLTQTTPEGFLVNPPDQRSNTQRIFVPRTALESLTVLAVIGATRRQRRGSQDQRQVPMFEE